MQELTETEQQALSDLFTELDDREIRYVILRKYDRLPEFVRGDIDLLVEATEFSQAIDACENVGFELPDGSEPEPLLRRVLANPGRAAKIAITSPRTILRALRMGSTTGNGVRKRKLQYGDIDLDMVNHLAYPEVVGERAPPSVEKRMLDRRRRLGQFYVPSPVDELAHVVTHCLVDYKGTFPAYYEERCETLVNTIESNETAQREFRDLMLLLYGERADRIVESVLTGEIALHGDTESVSPQPTP